MNSTTYQGAVPAASASPSDWAGSPLSTMHYRATQAQPIPIEQYPDGSCHVIRLELPGVDPANDLTVSVENSTLTVLAERRDAPQLGRETEFRYGSFVRHIALPLGANAQDVTASCRRGVLTVRIGIEPEREHGARKIDVAIEP